MFTVVANNKSNYVQVVELNPSAKGITTWPGLYAILTVVCIGNGLSAPWRESTGGNLNEHVIACLIFLPNSCLYMSGCCSGHIADLAEMVQPKAFTFVTAWWDALQAQCNYTSLIAATVYVHAHEVNSSLTSGAGWIYQAFPCACYFQVRGFGGVGSSLLLFVCVFSFSFL